MKIKKILFILFAILFANIDIIKAYDSYKIGDKINYNGIDYYVISNSNEKKSYVTLMKATPLNGTEISTYANGTINKEIIGTIPFASNTQTCQNVDNNGGCTSVYNETIIKQIVDSWANDNIGQNNYQEARLINNDDLNNLDFGMVKECAQTINYYSCYYGGKEGNNYRLSKVEFDHVEYWQLEDNNSSFNAFSCSPVENINSCNFSLCYGGESKGRIADYMSVLEDNSSGCAQYSTSEAELITSKNYGWLNYNNIPYWTMAIDHSYGNVDPNSTTNYIYYYNPERKMMKSSKSNDSGLHRLNAIRPVIELKKANIDNHKATYQIGEEITINKEKYNVIKNSDSNDEYVTVLKYKPLTQFQIDSYISNEKEGLTNYYVSDTCNSKNNSDGCEYDYSKSNVKTIVDNWTQSNTNEFDLYEKNSYKSRLITLDELINNLGYEKRTSSAINISSSEDTPKWVYENIDNFWMMPENINSSKDALKVSMYVIPTETFNSGTVRPIINLRKCAIDGGCYDENVLIGCDETENNNDVEVENTLSSVSKIVLITSLLLIISGVSMIIIYYQKAKKEKQ